MAIAGRDALVGEIAVIDDADDEQAAAVEGVAGRARNAGIAISLDRRRHFLEAVIAEGGDDAIGIGGLLNGIVDIIGGDVVLSVPLAPNRPRNAAVTSPPFSPDSETIGISYCLTSIVRPWLSWAWPVTWPSGSTS